MFELVVVSSDAHAAVEDVVVGIRGAREFASVAVVKQLALLA